MILGILVLGGKLTLYLFIKYKRGRSDITSAKMYDNNIPAVNGSLNNSNNRKRVLVLRNEESENIQTKDNEFAA